MCPRVKTESPLSVSRVSGPEFLRVLVTSDLHPRRPAIGVVMMAVMQMRQHNYSEHTETAPPGQQV
jgi:hypothetical protein